MNDLVKEIHLYNSITRQYEKTYPTQKALEEELGLYRGAVGDALRNRNNRHNLLLSYNKYDAYPEMGEIKHIVVEPSKISGTPINMLSESELRKKHDMYFMIYSFVSGLPEGKFIDEPSMLRQLSLFGKPRYREALARPELKDFRGKVDGVVYYGSMQSIKKLKMEGVLQ